MKKVVLSLALTAALACGTCMPVAGAADAPGWQYADGAYAGEDVRGRVILGSGNSVTAAEAAEELQPMLSAQFGSDTDAVVYRNGIQLDDSSKVATGDTISVPGSASPVAVVVKGDVSGTGAPGLLQVIKISKALRGAEDLTPSQLEAADANNSGKVDLGDVVLAVKYMNNASVADKTAPEATAEGESRAAARPTATAATKTTIKSTTTKATAKPTATSAAKSATSSNAVTAKFMTTVFDGTNAVRAKNGVTPALKESAKLNQAAQVRADELAASGTLSHTRPDGSKYSTVCTLGKGLVVGENIHCNKGYPLDETADVAMKGWENSAAHLKQMLEPRYSHIGLGFAQGKDGTWYCVQLFSNGDNVLSVDTPKA